MLNDIKIVFYEDDKLYTFCKENAFQSISHFSIDNIDELL